MACDSEITLVLDTNDSNNNHLPFMCSESNLKDQNIISNEFITAETIHQ